MQAREQLKGYHQDLELDQHTHSIFLQVNQLLFPGLLLELQILLRMVQNVRANNKTHSISLFKKKSCDTHYNYFQVLIVSFVLKNIKLCIQG